MKIESVDFDDSKYDIVNDVGSKNNDIVNDDGEELFVIESPMKKHQDVEIWINTNGGKNTTGYTS